MSDEELKSLKLVFPFTDISLERFRFRDDVDGQRFGSDWAVGMSDGELQPKLRVDFQWLR
ncbi:unnamed protein product [Rhodiola kirilowii]